MILWEAPHQKKGKFGLKAIRFKIELSHFCEISIFLGMNFQRDRENKTFLVNQTHSIEQLAEKFRVVDAHPVKTPAQKSQIARLETETEIFENKIFFQQLAGSLLYFERCTRRDTSFPTNLICRYMSKPTKIIWEIAKYWNSQVFMFWKRWADKS